MGSIPIIRLRYPGKPYKMGIPGFCIAGRLLLRFVTETYCSAGHVPLSVRPGILRAPGSLRALGGLPFLKGLKKDLRVIEAVPDRAESARVGITVADPRIRQECRRQDLLL